ncbi:NPH3 domain-containing protein [Caenorhabditis elegans]|uniref:NPH3 domain-containing protein n=2 Tax=Caenorhabditis elegans TaxID=6239 RepID=F8Y423_CAEEL|nr:NPH3 domain-containing protein [Caenorhabditis elegans]CCD73633.1 NPH3 domain-containing protein [Caenorhabditis elegans]|eukprot:NP_001254015.1 Uncharacterized protein CELE_W04H10.6 [Caenorhabditis elegans]
MSAEDVERFNNIRECVEFVMKDDAESKEAADKLGISLDLYISFMVVTSFISINKYPRYIPE